MTPGEIIEKLKAAQLALTRGNVELKTLGIKKAKAEREYKVALRKELLKLRYKDKLPANMVADVAKGKEEIADLRVRRDISESSYYTAISAVDNLRLEIETLRSLLTWLRVEFKSS